ncbi:MAG TPA: hypothetical protein VHZ81_14085 [Galbitalea sp.]|jgi:hypothetical protein|nr:hypothetical protein [Galbitalea sp.]
MINNQKITRAFGTPLRTALAIGATSLVAAGGLLGAGAASATAATGPSVQVAAHASVPVHDHLGALSLLKQLRADLFDGQVNGTGAQALATRIVDNPTIFGALPTNLQSDLTALKNAQPADANALAEQITSTALSGGYGTQIQNLASALKASAKNGIDRTLVANIREDVTSILIAGATPAPQPDVTGQKSGPQISNMAHTVAPGSSTASGTHHGESLGQLFGSLFGGSGK